MHFSWGDYLPDIFSWYTSPLVTNMQSFLSAVRMRRMFVCHIVCIHNKTACWTSMFRKCTANSLAPGRFEQNFRQVIFKLISVTDGWDISCKIALRWMPLDLTEDKSTLVQVMAWCHQATSHYLSQCWHRLMSPYGVTRPQWVNSSRLRDSYHL